jgi:gas vesicle protein
MAQTSQVIRSDIEQARVEMGETLDALGYKANVPARTRGWFARKKDRVTDAGGSALSSLSDATDTVVSKVSGATGTVVTKVSDATPSTGDVQAGAGRVKNTAEGNPLALAMAGAAVGFVVGIFAPSTRVEDEKIGQLADEVKSTATEAGQEALEHGKQVAKAAAESAVETAKHEGKEHSEELASSVQEKAREATPSPPSQG